MCIEELQSKLRDQSLLSYFTIENITYGILIDEKCHKVFKCESALIQKAIGNIHVSLNSGFYLASVEKNQKQFEESITTLYAELIRPIKKVLKEQVLIISEPYFSGVPWDALYDKYEKQVNGVPQYLLFEHEISILGQMYIQKQWQRPSKTNLDLLGIAPEFDTKHFINNEEELEQVSGGLRTKLLLDSLDIIRFQSALQDENARIIHISSHAEVDRLDGSKSGILLGKSNSRMTVEQISQLRITPELVFLNVCSSAKKSTEDQNSISIAEAFLEAGASSAIGTLWEIDDQVAKKVAIQTYKGLKDGKRTAEALRISKIKLIEEAKLRSHIHPYYWASYQVFGENTAILGQSRNRLKLLGSFIFSILTTFSMAYYYFSSRFKRLIIDRNWI